MFAPMATLFWSYWTRLFLASFGIFTTRSEATDRADKVADIQSQIEPVAYQDATAEIQSQTAPAEYQHKIADIQTPIEPAADRHCPRCGARDLRLLERYRFEDAAGKSQRYVHEKWRCSGCGYFEQNIFPGPC